MTTTPSGAAREIGVGLISVGWMGKLHSRAYQALPSVYPELGLKPRLVHAADTAEDRAAYARDVLGYEKAGTDYRAVLDDPDVEVVSICAPNMLHHEIGIAAAKAGKPFWIEKPVGRGAEETAEVAAAARAAGVVTSIGYNYRHAPAVERAGSSSPRGGWAASPTCAPPSSPATPPNPRAPCPGASSGNWPDTARWAT
jgi:predicted dehydrogenase